eukprot:TRINITY_DN1667_c0_g1_i5.p1 TRINITY_DN1667_c0_g1~~TRINITY_DN1667_c0_g1_i5.p1  ORF type:complete len:128 (-),score=17.75 TRINITY_DN1667_c0_g1_i5:49-432(-)
MIFGDQGWMPTTDAQYFGFCVLVAAICLLREFLSGYRQKMLVERRNKVVDVQTSLIQPASNKNKGLELDFQSRIMNSLLYFVTFTLAYAIMLIAMTYNAGLFLVIIFSSLVGHFFFSHDHVIFDECC